MDTFIKYIIYIVLFPLFAWGWGVGQTASDLQPFLPGKSFDKTWVLDGEVEAYRPENLFQYIDGEAEMYNDYGFVDMITAYYIHDQRTDLAFSLDIYDMGSPLNAFGIYSAYRRPDLHFASFGKEATVSNTNVRLYKGRYFVQVNVGAIDSLSARAIRDCAREVAGKLPSGSSPGELSWLPTEGQVPHSLAYKTTGFMGQESIHSVLQAEYSTSTGSCTGFLAWFDTEAEADTAMRRLERSLSQQGTVTRPPEEPDGSLISAETRFQGNILVQCDSRYLAGAMGFDHDADAQSLVRRILLNMHEQR